MISNPTEYRCDEKSDGELDSDIEVKSEKTRNYFENSKHDAIDILSSSSDSDVEMTKVKMPGRKVNDVWRNIIECDLLQQQMVNISNDQEKVQRDVESYELPPNRKRKYNPYRRKNRNRNRTYRRYSAKIDEDTEVLVLDDDDNGSKNQDLDVVDITSDHNTECDSFDMGDVISYNTNSLGSNLISDASSSSDSDLSDSESVGKRRKLKVGGKKIEGAWDRLANRIQNENMMVEFEHGRKQVSQKIAKTLNEPKVELVDRCLYFLGLPKCKVFLEAVKEIEDCGGMPTKDGSRRRTAGGVFFTLIRADRSIESGIKQQIFDEKEDITSQDGESLWWKSLEILQYRFNYNAPNYSKPNQPNSTSSHSPYSANNRDSGFTRKCTSNFARRKEFKSYTLIDIDFFEAIPGFQYRYIPMMANFPIQTNDTGLPSENGSYEDSFAREGHTTPTNEETIIIDESDDEENQDDYFMRLPEHLDPFNPLDL